MASATWQLDEGESAVDHGALAASWDLVTLTTMKQELRVHPV